MLQRIYGTAWENQGRAGGAPPPPGGGREARPPPPGRGAGPALVPVGARRRAGRVAPQGRGDPQADGGLQPGPPRGRRVRVRLHPAPGQGRPLPDLRPPRLVQGEHVPGHGHGQRVLLPEAHELPDALPDLPQPDAQLPRAAAAPVRAGHRLPLRAGGHPPRPAPHPRLHPGRRPHLLHRRAGPRTRSAGCSASCCRSCGPSGSRSSSPTSPPATRSSRSAREAAWETATADAPAPRWRRRASSTRSRRATRPSTGRRSTSTCATPSVAAGSCRPSSTTSTCRSGSSWSTSGADNERHQPVMIHRALFGLRRAVLRRPDRALRRRLPGLAVPDPGPGAAGRGRARGLRQPTWRPGCRARASGSTRSTRPTSWAAASAPPSWRSCPTCWWWATTTWPPGRSASTPVAATSSATCSSSDFVARLRADVAVADRQPGRVSDGAVLERLWNGWRTSYVSSVPPPDDEAAGGPSVFTRILQSGLPDEETHVVHRGDDRVRHPQRLPVLDGAHPGAAVPRGGRAGGPDPGRAHRAVGDGHRRRPGHQGRLPARRA